MIVKIRYKNINPKDTFIKDYTKYIEDGGLSLKAKEELFKDSFGDVFHELYEYNEDQFAQDYGDHFIQQYGQYIEDRQGSQILFSDVNADVEHIKEILSKKSKGVVYFPIISLKETEALEYGFTQEVMVQKAREVAKMFKEELNIPDEDYNWLCAYHEQPIEKRNPKAGKMPHLHFILFSGNLNDGYHTKATLNKLRKKSIDIFYKEHRQKILMDREQRINDLKTFVTDKELHQRLKTELNTLYSTLIIINKGKGKIQYKALETNRNIITKIKENLLKNQPLSTAQHNFLKKNELQMDVEVLNSIIEHYDHFFRQVHHIIYDIILESYPYKQIYKEYIDFSKELRSFYGTGKMYQKLIEEDKEKIFNNLKNAVIRLSVRDYIESKNKVFIDEERFLEALYSGFPAMQLSKNYATNLCKEITKVLFHLEYDLEEIYETLDKFIEKQGHNQYDKSEIQDTFEQLKKEKEEKNLKGYAYTLSFEELKHISSEIRLTKKNSYVPSFYNTGHGIYMDNQIRNLKKHVDHAFITSFHSFYHPVQSDHWDLITAQRKYIQGDYVEELKKRKIQILLSYGIDIRI